MSVLVFLNFITSSATVFAAPKVVFPRLLEERTADGGMFLRIDSNLTLSLTKSSVAAPNLRVIRFEGGQEVTEFHNGADVERSLYHDSHRLAAVSLTQKDSSIEVEGVVGPYTRIEPSSNMERSEDGSIAHFLHEIPQQEFLDESVYASAAAARTGVTERNYEPARRVPNSVEIEVFIVVDTFHHRNFVSTNKLLRYICTMVITVNIRYEDARDSTIKLLLTGLEKSQNEPYLTNKGAVINGNLALTTFRAYADKRRKQFGDPDVAFWLTGRDTYTIKDGKREKGLQGVAYLAGVCTANYAGYAEDTPGVFSGIRSLAHEMGHLLGASHDGTGAETSDPQRPTSLSCSWHTGYLMSYIKKNYLHHVFSGCSLAQMRYTLRRLTVSCWTVKAKKVYNVTRDYPGMVMNITEYCKKSFPFERNVTSDPSTPALKSTCNVRCLFKRFIKVTRMGKEVWEWTLHQSFISALEYTRCAEGKVCIQGRCVTPPEDQPTR